VAIHHDGGNSARSFDLWPLFERTSRGARLLLRAAGDAAGGARHVGALVGLDDHIESFADAGTLAVAGDRPFRVRLARTGTAVDVGAGQSILEALREHGLDVPSSCESGTCGTCRTRLLAGDADHRDLVLSEAEHADSIMVCVSRARSPEIVIDR
jgi:phthalate 4,5-dioxygenase reductase subunit